MKQINDNVFVFTNRHIIRIVKHSIYRERESVGTHLGLFEHLPFYLHILLSVATLIVILIYICMRLTFRYSIVTCFLTLSICLKQNNKLILYKHVTTTFVTIWMCVFYSFHSIEFLRRYYFF